jgi:hypothetical protein
MLYSLFTGKVSDVDLVSAVAKDSSSDSAIRKMCGTTSEGLGLMLGLADTLPFPKPLNCLLVPDSIELLSRASSMQARRESIPLRAGVKYRISERKYKDDLRLKEQLQEGQRL